MVVCLTGIKFNMKADILRQGRTAPVINFDVTDTQSEWVMQQDPDSGEVIRKWQNPVTTVDNPNTPEYEGLETISCVARGIIDGGIRVAGTTERFSQEYENIDYVSLTVGPKAKISKRDRITNIRNKAGIVLWKEEEQPNSPPTVFEVLGVTPVIDPFGSMVEQKVFLARAEIQT